MTVGTHVDLCVTDHETVIAQFSEAYKFKCVKSNIETTRGTVRTYTMWSAEVGFLDGTLYVHVWDGKITGSAIFR